MKQVKFKFAPKYNSRRFPMASFNEVAYKEDGTTEPVALTKADVLKSLGTIKDALELSLKGKIEEVVKNADEKLEAVKADLEKAHKLKEDASAETIERIEKEAKITQAALDIIQTRQKSQQMSTQAIAPESVTFADAVAKGFNGFRDNITKCIISKGKNETTIQLKAVGDMTIAANLTGNIPNTYRDGIVPVPHEMVHMRSLVSVTPSTTDSYHFYRHSVGEGSIEFQTQELETKEQIDEDLSEQTVNLNYLAGWLRISRKMLKNFAGLQSYITRWLPERYYQREDTRAYQALVSAATGVQDTSGTDMISMIIRTIGKQKKAKYNVNGIVIDGEVWAKILTYKASTSGEFTQPIGVVSIGTNGQMYIMGIPVYTASWVGGDEAIVGDWKNFEIIQSEGLSLQFFEQDGTNVRENKITARIEASIGFAILDPKAFVVVALESVS